MAFSQSVVSDVTSSDVQFEDIEVRPGRTLRLYYQKVANRVSAQSDVEEKTILFIHGVGGCGLLWKKQMEYFYGKGYDVYAPDLYGHGDSQPQQAESKQADMMFVELRQDILELFDWINSTACIIVGHSYGASFATYLCKERESQVTKLVMISGGRQWPLKTFCCSLYRLPVCCFNMCGDLLRRGFMALAFSESPPNDGDLAYNLTPAMFRYTMRGQVWREANREYHAGIKQPTLLIVGTGDNFVSRSETRQTEAVIPGARLVTFHRVGHMVMLEVPEQLNETILDFIKPTVIISEPKLQSGQTHTKVHSKLL